MKYLADINLAPTGGFQGFGPLGLEGKDGSGAIGVFSNFLSSLVGIITVVGVIWFVVVFITGVVGIIGSGGEKGALESARGKITNAVIGLVVLIAALFLIDLVGYLFGIPDILDLGKMFSAIQIK
jgi:hypothetical protein